MRHHFQKLLVRGCSPHHDPRARSRSSQTFANFRERFQHSKIRHQDAPYNHHPSACRERTVRKILRWSGVKQNHDVQDRTERYGTPQQKNEASTLRRGHVALDRWEREHKSKATLYVQVDSEVDVKQILAKVLRRPPRLNSTNQSQLCSLRF